MATGLLSGEDSSGEKEAWTDNNNIIININNSNNNNKNNNKNNSNSKVYTRKNQNKTKNPDNDPEEQKTLATTTTTITEDNTNSSQPQLVSVASDDSSGHNQLHPAPENHPLESTKHSVAVSSMYVNSGTKVRINLNCITKSEVKVLKRKLVSELDQVRSLTKEVQKKEIWLSEYSHSYNQSHQNPTFSGSEKNRVVGSLARVNSEVGSVGFVNSQPFKDGSEFVEKQKRTPKTNQYYKNSEFVMGDEKLDKMIGSNKKLKTNGEMMGFVSSSQLFKRCSNLLGRLMRHKFCWVFKAPVEVKKLGLHDYFTIIKHPMDLGTVKSRLSENWYKSAKGFAEDVRLTFSNALLYNPEGQDVHYMAQHMSEIFEEKWKAIEDEFNLNRRVEVGYDVNFPNPTSRRGPANPVSVPTPAPPIPTRPALGRRTLERAESMTMSVDSKLKSGSYGPMGRTPVSKKPKAKELDKRDMTFEEKQRLSVNLQNLHSENLDIIVQIIKKRNSRLFQHQDEIELDIESVDPETLWELDRFVTNYQKSLSKNKRQADPALQATAEGGHDNQEVNLAPAVAEAPRETDAVEKINASPSPVRGEQQGDNVSGSSSSSSSSSDSGSSSSDSDSDSSSGSGSDADQ